MKKKSNIVKFAKRIDFNVGYLVFIVIVLYIIASVIMYATSKKTTIYQVSDGSLSVNNVYTGFVMRDEDVIKSDYAGTINYYSNDCDKADKVSVIYSIDETGHIAELLEKYSDKVLNEDDLKSIKSMLSEYTSFYSNNTFGNIYSTKKSVISKLNRSHYNVIVNDLDNIISQAGNTTLFHKEKAIKTGIVMFSIDGYEDFKESAINPDVFDMSNYNIRNLKDNNIVNVFDPVYRIINSDNWSIYIPLDATSAAQFADTKSARIRFVDSDITCSVNMSIIKNGDNTYARLDLNKYMINYADKRFVNIEFVETRKSGLKIPVSSVFNKSFYTVPHDFVTESNKIVRIYYTKNGDMQTETIDPDIMGSDDKYYYISMNDFESGDIIISKDSSEQYIIGTMGELTGVYCVNRGYAVFKPITIIDKNDDYYIIKKDANYGLKVYDHIVLDYTTVKENELVN